MTIPDAERLRAELEASDAAWRTMADSIPQLAWIADASGWIFWYNRRWYDYTGTTLELMQGWGWREVHHPEHLERVLEFVSGAWESGDPWELTFPLRAADGGYRWFLTRAQPLRDASGRLVRWLGTNTDITERIEAGEQHARLAADLAALNRDLEARVAQRTSEVDHERAFVRTLLDTAADGFFGADADGINRFVNPAAARMLGYEVDELLGAPQHAKIHHHHADGRPFPREECRIYRSFIEGTSFRVTDEVFWRKDGSSFPVEYSVSPIRDEAGRVTGSVTTFRDISERRAAEQALRRSQAELAAQAAELGARARALKAFTDFTEAAGTETDRLTLTERALEVTVSALGENAAGAYWELRDNLWKALSWRGALDAETVTVIRAGLPREAPTLVAAERSPGPVFVDGFDAANDRVATVDARRFEANSVSPVRVGGRLIGVLSAGLSHAGAWPERDRATVRAVVRSLTLALERADSVARVEAQRAELEARNAEQETFVYTVSHDLRQPLLAMQGMSELLAEAVELGDKGQASFMASRVARNVDRMGRLLDDLLALSRVGRADAEREAFDLGEVVAQALAELEPRVRARGASLELPREWPRVLFPRGESGQLLGNLLGNALKYGGRENLAPRVRLSWSSQSGRVTVRVNDNGPGVPPAYRERVFGLFQKLDASSEGTGVGLAIVRRIVERHGGKVWIEDSELGGACFALTLPGA